MTIYKYPLEITDAQAVQMPLGAKILSVHAQAVDRICLWAIVNESSTDRERREIEIFGTGHNMPSGERVFIGTVLTYRDMYVWHVFERLT
jgi:hypothetical protein